MALKEIVRFEADLPRRELFEEWLNKRALWQRNELLARKAMKVFEQLYELHGQLERESERYEMVLGDGIVSWRLPDGGIFHPVLIRRIQLEFDPQVPRFRVVDVDRPTELYTALFSAVPDVDGRSLEQCRSELAQGGYHPLERDSNAFLKRFAVVLSSRGSIVEDGRPPNDTEFPTIGRALVLFLRSRAQSFAQAIEQLLSNITERSDLPNSLLNIVGIEDGLRDGEATQDSSGLPKARLSRRDILFSKMRINSKKRLSVDWNSTTRFLCKDHPAPARATRLQI